MCDSQIADTMNTCNNEHHKLNSKWILWAHLPHDIDWSIKSYKKIAELSTIEEVLSIYANLPPKLVVNCMLFLMRADVAPIWEDPKNCKGGSFAYKLNNKTVPSCWKSVSYGACGESLTNNKKLQGNITGITISPKKNFCILKIWTTSCEYQDAALIKTDSGLTLHGCLFKKHSPTY